MRFPRNTSFDSLFAGVEGARWHPFVGKDFGSNGRRLMVYAHNIPIKPAEYERKLVEWADPATWANAIDEYTYEQGWWTEAFRYFIKGAVGLKENYNANSSATVTDAVDRFVNGMAYLNFIQDLVKSEGQIATASWEQVTLSQKVNRDFLRTLEISHCICWGTPTYNYLKSIQGYRVLSEQSEGKRGFSSSVVETETNTRLKVLRIFHPSMPQGFSPYSESTQKIIAEFLSAVS